MPSSRTTSQIPSTITDRSPLPWRVTSSFTWERSRADVKRITLPTLLMWGTSDRLCLPAGSELVAANIGSKDLTVKPYEGLFHEIMNEPERDQVLDDLVAWLDGHVGDGNR